MEKMSCFGLYTLHYCWKWACGTIFPWHCPIPGIKKCPTTVL